MNDNIYYTPETPSEGPERHEVIARGNDVFRKTFNPMMGEVLMTRSVSTLDEMSQRQLIMLVQGFNTFTEDNDPHMEHDFGSIDFGGTTYFWKIDLYDRETRSVYSPDPTDPNLTLRVLTIMEASDW